MAKSDVASFYSTLEPNKHKSKNCNKYRKFKYVDWIHDEIFTMLFPSCSNPYPLSCWKNGTQGGQLPWIRRLTQVKGFYSNYPLHIAENIPQREVFHCYIASTTILSIHMFKTCEHQLLMAVTRILLILKFGTVWHYPIGSTLPPLLFSHIIMSPILQYFSLTRINFTSFHYTFMASITNQCQLNLHMLLIYCKWTIWYRW